MHDALLFTKRAHRAGNARCRAAKIQQHAYVMLADLLVTAGVNVVNPAHEVSIFSRLNIAAYQDIEVRVPLTLGFALLYSYTFFLAVVLVEVAIVIVPIVLSHAYFLFSVSNLLITETVFPRTRGFVYTA